VSDLEEQRRIQKILVAIERHKKWLDVSAVQLASNEEVKRLANSFRTFLGHFQRRIYAGETDLKSTTRRRRKMELAAFALWKASHRRDL
jgi:hypothetical protein